jgi:hypothetical protein
MKTKSIVIALPEDLHTLVKMEAARTKRTLKQFVIDALEKTVERRGESVDIVMSKQTGSRKKSPR